MNRIVVTCLLFGMLVGKSAVAQTTESAISNTQNDLSNRVGPEEKRDSLAIYQGCSRSVEKVASFGTVYEVLDAAEKLTETLTRANTWVATGNLEHAQSLAKSNRDSLRTKTCYVYSKSGRCGWRMLMKTLTAQEAEAHVAKLKETSNYPLAIIYELE